MKELGLTFICYSFIIKYNNSGFSQTKYSKEFVLLWLHILIDKRNIFVIHRPGSDSIGRNYARGREYRPRPTASAVLRPTEGRVSPNTDRPRPVNNIFIFFQLRFKSFRKIFLHSPTYVCWSRTRLCWWSARSIVNQNKTLKHDFQLAFSSSLWSLN